MDEIALLTGLLQRYSPTFQEAEAAAYLVTQMQAAGFEARVDEAGNAVGVMGDGPREIMMLGHIDTVPGCIAVQRDDDRLYGRGAVDAKGPLACFAAATALAGAREGFRFVVIGAVGEEGDSRGAQFVRDHYAPDLLIIGEPSSWDRVTLGYKGSAWFEYEAQRTLAHPSANVGERVPGCGEFLESRDGSIGAVECGPLEDVRSAQPRFARDAIALRWLCRDGAVKIQFARAAGYQSRRSRIVGARAGG